MNRRGSTTLQGVIIFMAIAVVITAIYQTVQFSRVRTVVQNAAEEAARVYATNYENPNREKSPGKPRWVLWRPTSGRGRSPEPTRRMTSRPAGFKAHWGKKDDRYVLQTVPYEAATESLRAELDRLVGKHVAAKIEAVTDESAKWSTVSAVPDDLKPAPKTGINIIPGQLEFAWYHPVSGMETNRAEMDRTFAEARDRIKGKGVVKNRPINIATGAVFPELKDLPQTDFLLEFSGYLYIPETGTYVFGLDSDDAADVLIDDVLAVQSYGAHPMSGAPVPGPELELERGYHPFRVRLHQGPGVFGLQVYWKAGGSELHADRTEVFRFRRSGDHGEDDHYFGFAYPCFCFRE